ncbi:FUN14 family-domain-containing protein [Pelagophyceae sp. CCMP2097]|nr:FUN14 family-domain-containing protein [Pelagophyceae sp. CCMP2097]
MLGSTLGYASGYTLRFAGRVASVALGSGFILLQALSYVGYVAVDWRKVERDAVRSLDRDGDGEVTATDVALLWREATDVLAFNLPAGTGFTAGLLYGINATSMTTAGGLAAVGGLGARVLLPRVALGVGAGATGLPAILVTAKQRPASGFRNAEARGLQSRGRPTPGKRISPRSYLGYDDNEPSAVEPPKLA